MELLRPVLEGSLYSISLLVMEKGLRLHLLPVREKRWCLIRLLGLEKRLYSVSAAHLQQRLHQYPQQPQSQPQAHRGSRQLEGRPKSP
jgi:hypothetical protein